MVDSNLVLKTIKENSSSVHANSLIHSTDFLQVVDCTRIEAYLTLVTSDDFVIGAQVLAYSLIRVHASRPLFVMVTTNVTSKAQHDLKIAGYQLLPVCSIPNPNTDVHVKQWRDVGFTKLRLWQLEAQFSKVVYIDADCIVVENCDELFDLPVSFAAAPDIFPPDHFNAGVMVVSPSLNLFRKMLAAIPYISSYDGGDTGFLNNFFPNWHRCSSVSRLSFGYNALRVMQWYTKKKPTYWSAIKPLKIVHYCSSPKPWEDALLRRGDFLEQQWWRFHDKMIEVKKKKQSLLDSCTNLESARILPNEKSIQIPNKYNSIGKESIHQSNPCINTLHHHDLNQSTTTEKIEMKRANILNTMLSVSFRKAMTPRKIKWKIWSVHDKQLLEYTKKRYDHYARQEIDISTSRIPRVIHQIWLGGPIPSQFDSWRNSWRIYHPQWQYKLWTDEDLLELKHTLSSTSSTSSSLSDLRGHFLNLLDNAIMHVEKSDILRLWILLEHGGLYVDTDFQCLQSFDQLHASFDFYAGLSNTGCIEVNNALIGCCPRHPLIVECLKKMRLSEHWPLRTANHIIERSGPGHFTRSIISYLGISSTSSFPSNLDEKKVSMIILPTTYFYPLPNTMRHLTIDTDKKVYVTKESFSIHHWNCGWMKLQSDEANDTPSQTKNIQVNIKNQQINIKKKVTVSTSKKKNANINKKNAPKRKEINMVDFMKVMNIVKNNQNL